MEIEKLIRKNIWELKSFRYGSESLSGSLSAGIEERTGPTEGSEGGSYDFGKWER